MNRFLKKWIDETIDEFDGEFTAIEMKERIFFKRNSSNLLENTASISSYLKRHTRLATIPKCSGKNNMSFVRV